MRPICHAPKYTLVRPKRMASSQACLFLRNAAASIAAVGARAIDQDFELRAGQCIGPSILNALHLKLKALAEVTTVPLPSGEQLSSLFLTLGFDAPFLGASDKHRRVKRLQFGLEFLFQCGYGHCASSANHPRSTFYARSPIGTNRKRNRRFLLSGPNTLDSERS
jgi:hypothetical protein